MNKKQGLLGKALELRTICRLTRAISVFWAGENKESFRACPKPNIIQLPWSGEFELYHLTYYSINLWVVVSRGAKCFLQIYRSGLPLQRLAAGQSSLIHSTFQWWLFWRSGNHFLEFHLKSSGRWWRSTGIYKGYLAWFGSTDHDLSSQLPKSSLRKCKKCKFICLAFSASCPSSLDTLDLNFRMFKTAQSTNSSMYWNWSCLW